MADKNLEQLSDSNPDVANVIFPQFLLPKGLASTNLLSVIMFKDCYLRLEVVSLFHL